MEGASPSAAVVVMGVSGSGKSSVGARLAERLGVRFIEGDALHPAMNIARMRARRALDDADRAPWLARVGVALDAAVESDGAAVASCSALKRRYRDALRAAVRPPVLFVWLNPPEAALARRLAARTDHFMPPVLLASQLADLEPPGGEERALELSGVGGVEETADAALAWVRAGAQRGWS